jgi:hypothetical protein
LLGFSTSDMKDKCREHVEDMIVNPEYVEQVTAGCHSQIPAKVLAAAVQFSNTKDVGNPFRNVGLKLTDIRRCH